MTTTTISGSSGPVALSNDGTLIVNSTGTIAGGSTTAVTDAGTISVLTNSGQITASTVNYTYFSSPDAIQAGYIGTLTNSGLISGLSEGVYSRYGIGTVSNSGSIIGGSPQGCAILVGGSIGTLTNTGLLQSGAVAIECSGSASIYNGESGTITSGEATVDVGADSTIENAGTITNTDAAYGFLALDLRGSDETLIVDPTSVIIGGIDDPYDSGKLVIGGTTANTQTFSTSQYTGFSTIEFDNGHATLVGSAADLASVAITGFTKGDSIELDNFSATGSSISGSILTLSNGLTTTTLDIGSADPLSDFIVTSHDGTTTTSDPEPLCFLPGSLILTPGGEVPVEQLRAGDRLVTLDGCARPIRWIGYGRLLAPAGRRAAATPVLIRRGALAQGVPHRDLYVTKGHAIHLDGVLIPAEFLVNHRSILWDDRGQEVTFYHIDMGGHEVLRANGAPAESYRDEGNRWMFANANPAWDQPGVAPFAPVLTGGKRVDAAWRRLLERSGDRLHLATTGEPDLHLLVDGARVAGRRLSHDVYSFILPAGASHVAIASRASAPDVLGVFRDPRLLGVAVSRIVLWRGGASHIIDADNDALTDGFHGYEPAEGCRWTNGHAVLPPNLLPPCPEPHLLQLHIRHTARYASPEAEELLLLRA